MLKFSIRDAKTLPPIAINDKVMMQDSHTRIWEPSKVTKIDQNRPPSYLVETDKNKSFVRNRRFLRKFQDNNFKGDTYNNEQFEDVLESYLKNNSTVTPIFEPRTTCYREQ